MADMIKILCVDDERNVLKSLRRLFMDEDDYEIFVAGLKTTSNNIFLG